MTKTAVCVLVVGLVLLPTVPRAEVSAVPGGGQVRTLVLSVITDDSDPVGAWAPHRPVTPTQILNPDGDIRGDGRPDIVYRDNSWPVVTWAYNAGSDFDIAFSEWDGAAWSVTAFLTATAADDLDPRLFVEADGAAHVVWWSLGATEEVYLATRPAGSGVWEMPILVTAGVEEGRRPSVTVSDGDLLVSYERDSTEPGMAQEIVVATLLSGGSGFSLETIGWTSRAERLDAMLHVAPEHLWVDWKHDPDEFGRAEHDGAAWSLDPSAPWTDPSWVGVEGTRKALRSQVLQ